MTSPPPYSFAQVERTPTALSVHAAPYIPLSARRGRDLAPPSLKLQTLAATLQSHTANSSQGQSWVSQHFKQQQQRWRPKPPLSPSEATLNAMVGSLLNSPELAETPPPPLTPLTPPPAYTSGVQSPTSPHTPPSPRRQQQQQYQPFQEPHSRPLPSPGIGTHKRKSRTPATSPTGAVSAATSATAPTAEQAAHNAQVIDKITRDAFGTVITQDYPYMDASLKRLYKAMLAEGTKDSMYWADQVERLRDSAMKACSKCSKANSSSSLILQAALKRTLINTSDVTSPKMEAQVPRLFDMLSV
ncbi:hypothetical protein RI367_005510 [Sorochytrium milnesiophthora]